MAGGTVRVLVRIADRLRVSAPEAVPHLLHLTLCPAAEALHAGVSLRAVPILTRIADCLVWVDPSIRIGLRAVVTQVPEFDLVVGASDCHDPGVWRAGRAIASDTAIRTTTKNARPFEKGRAAVPRRLVHSFYSKM